jgi:oligoendopeptidase F
VRSAQPKSPRKKVKKLRPRDRVPESDRWDLSSLFPTDEAWERAIRRWEKRIPRYAEFRGTLGRSPDRLAECLDFDVEFDRLGERIGTYAFLKTTENLADSRYQAMLARYRNAASRAAQEASFLRPEILALPAAKRKRFLAAKRLAPYRLLLERIFRHKPHTLSASEEKLLAMQSEMASASSKIFSQLADADLRFGEIQDDKDRTIELSHATFMTLLHSPDRAVRKRAFHQYYRQFDAHRNTIAAALEGSILGDVYYARARRHPSCLSAALFADNVPESVYDHLIASVHRVLPTLHRYYEVRRRALGLRDLHAYDTYVPIVQGFERRRPWNEAVRTVLEAVAPLGPRYVSALQKGLEGRWCDRYENQGKQSGAFSCGSYDGAPYILMNYQPEVLDHLFTLAHEAGHSMHSWLSARRQPFPYYSYTIFVAEVASTFNEQLLGRHLLAEARSDAERAYLVNREIDAIRGTILRQTMFAEFEKITHEIAERNEPLTVDVFRDVYRRLLELYFGPDVALDDELSLECLRIPHFYRAFYVYKYATGMSAAIALADRVTGGGARELKEYLGFLEGGCSKWPLDLLRGAGVDLERPDAVDAALARFEHLVQELERLLAVGPATSRRRKSSSRRRRPTSRS